MPQCLRALSPSTRMLVIQPADTEDEMTLRFLGTTSDDGDCPTLYEVVHGERETDPEHLVELRTSSRQRPSSASRAAC
jgi:hypothetical protein